MANADAVDIGGPRPEAGLPTDRVPRGSVRPATHDPGVRMLRAKSCVEDVGLVPLSWPGGACGTRSTQ